MEDEVRYGFKNKLGIENSAELARLEEQISKKKAAQLLKKVSYSG